MAQHSKFAATLIALALLGCKSAQPTSPVSSGMGDSGGTTSTLPAAVTSGGTRPTNIVDPTLNNMTAFTVKVPAGWKFTSSLFEGTGCQSIPSPVYEATSPDGKSGAVRMPMMVWVWGSGPLLANAQKQGCLPLAQTMSGQQFLKYLAKAMDLHYDGAGQVPAAITAADEAFAQQAKQNFSGLMNGPQPKSSHERARASVSFQHGSVQMKGNLDVKLDCTETTFASAPHLGPPTPGRAPQMIQGPPSILNKCIAIIQYLSAPADQLSSVARLWDTGDMGATADMRWLHAWIDRNKQQGEAYQRQIVATSDAVMQAQRQKFERDQATTQEMHDQFLSTIQRGTDMSMQRTQDGMDARGTSASDWIDHSLDRQTVMDTRTGVYYKTENQATVGGTLVKVHGDGTPIQ